MCGAPKTQEIVQKTELDPNLQRLLYGGIFQGPQPVASPAPATAGASSYDDGGGSDNNDDPRDTGSPRGGYTSFRDMFDGGGPGMAGTEFGGALGGISNALGFSPVEAKFDTRNSIDRGGLYAMGGPVMPQMGIASLNQGQMPMMGGQLPDLSDPMTAATLAMAVRNPQMQYGNIMAPPAGFAMGGYIEGPGTGTSDSVDAVIMQNGRPVQEALLSDGEFVMTERAVRGAGGGDREKGAARMYEMMRQFERGGRV
jgi:hypothetical protein